MIKNFLAVISGFGIWMLLGTYTVAMCVWFVPPGRLFEPADDIVTLVVQDGDKQRLVVQPQFSGDATDFGLVMPFPSEPKVSEAPKDVFTQLNDLTNPVIERPDFVSLSGGPTDTASESTQKRVEVIEKRDVGSYSATTLKANDATALTDWLKDNGYQIDKDKLAVLEAYIGEQDGYFVALKINVANADVDRNGLLKGELDPIEFSFTADDVMLPLRLMASSTSRIFNLLIYTIDEKELYIPGAALQFARKVSVRDIDKADVLERYRAEGKWLTRSVVELDSSKIEKDLKFYETPADVVVDVGDEAVRVNPDLLDPKTGLLEAETGTVRYVEESDVDDYQSSALKDDQTRPLIVITVLLGIANIFLINTVLKLKSTIEESSGK